MKCKVAVGINKGSNVSLVSKHGALATMTMITMNDSFNDVKYKIDRGKRATPKQLLKAKGEEFMLKSSLLTAGKNFDVNNSVGITSVENVALFISRRLGVTAEILRDTNQHFSEKSKLASTIITSKVPVVIEDGEFKSKLDINRDYFVIDEALLKKIDDLIDGSTSNTEREVLVDKYLRTFVLSALQRGYSINSRLAIASHSVADGVTKFKSLNPGKKVKYASVYQSASGTNGIIKISSGVKFANKADVPVKKIDDVITTESDNRTTTHFFTEEERTLINKFKEVSTSGRAKIAGGIATTFAKFIPNLKVEMLTSKEIANKYKGSFNNKKGFIIGGKIVVNLDLFDPSTMFHEFGHYFMTWLNEADSTLKADILSQISKQFPEKVTYMQNVYSNTGLKFSSDEILEEVFVSEIGMRAFKGLMSTMGDAAPVFGESSPDTDSIIDRGSLQVEKFTEQFIYSLLGSKSIPPKLEAAGMDFSIVDMLNNVTNFGTKNSPFIDSNDIKKSMKSMREFTIPKHTLTDVSHGLINRGLISKSPAGYFILRDIDGNIVDENGKITGKPTSIKFSTTINALKKIAVYVDQNKEFATIMYDIGMNQGDAIDQIESLQEKITKPHDRSYYMNGKKLRGSTGYISEHFGNAFDVDAAAKKKVFYDLVTTAKAANMKEAEKNEIDINEDQAELDAIDTVTKVFEEGRADSLIEEVKKVYEFKRIEGTYLHNINELYVLALNYSQEIDYGNGDKRSMMHFSEHITAAMQSGNKVTLEKYFNDYFFRHLKGKKETAKFKQFKAAYEFMHNNIEKEDAANIALLLQNLEKFFNKNIFKGMKGPLKLMPEVVIGNEQMGTVGIIDLLIIDGTGAAHIIDYKTKENRTFENWNYSKGAVRLKGKMSSYHDNAKMKASVQMSMYKVMLMEMGIKVDSINVAYTEAKIQGNGDVAFNDKDKLKYKVIDIFKTSLIDVSADVIEHFKETVGFKSNIDTGNSDSSEITGLMTKFSSGDNIDTQKDVDAETERIYKYAIEGKSKKKTTLEQAFLRSIASAEGGLVIYLPGNIKHTIPKEINTEEKQKKYIKDMLINRKDVAFIEADLEAVFSSLDRTKAIDTKVLGTQDKEKTMKGMLRGADSNTHEFVKVSSDVSYGNDFSGISFLKNKITGEVRVLSLNYDDERTIRHRDDSYNNILGSYISTNLLKSKYPELAEVKSSNYNLRLLKIGMMAIRAKQLDPNFKISYVLMNRQFELATSPVRVDMITVMALTKAALTEAKAAGEVLPEFFEEALATPDIFDPKGFVPNPTLALSNYISELSSSMNVFNEVFAMKTSKERAKAVQTIIDTYDERQDYRKLLTALQELQHSLEPAFSSFDKKLDSDLWRMIDDSILFIQGFNHTVSPENATYVQKFLFTPSTVSNKYMADFNRQISEGNAALRAEFIEYKDEFTLRIKALADERGVNLEALSPSLYMSSRKDLLKSLFVDPDNKDRKTAFLLKSLSKATSPAEKSLIDFIQKNLAKYAKSSIFRETDTTGGFLPLIKKSKLSKRSDTNYLQNAFESFKDTFKDDKFNDDISEDNDLEKEFYVNNPFDSQIPGKGDSLEDHFKRNTILGLDKYGNVVEGKEDALDIIEDNIENIMDSFMVSSLSVTHFRDVSAFGRAMFYNIRREQKLTGQPYDNIIDILTIIQRKNIKNKESDSQSKFQGVINKISTTAVIAGSVKQILLEAFTNPLITADNYLSDKIYGTLFGGQREFSAKSYTEAFNIAMNPMSKDFKLANKIDLFYGFSNSDTRNLQEMLKVLEGHSIFQSSNLLYVNKLILETWQKTTMIAYMIEQGSFHAHTLGSDGKLSYDEKKDKRYYGGKDAEFQDKFYDQMKLKLAKEYGGLTDDESVPYEDRKLKKAYTTFDINYLKEKLVELYSSLDNSSKSMSIYYTFMGALRKMRTWIFAKMARYFRKPSTAEENTSMSRLERVDDPDADGGYRLEWKGQAAEGILYSIAGMGRMLYEHKLEVLKSGSMSKIQKQNMSKLMGDMVIGVALSAAVYGMFRGLLDDDTRRNPMVKLSYDRFMMATGDAFMIKSLYDMTTGNGSMFIGYSITARALQNSLQATYMMATVGFDDEIDGSDVSSASWHAASSFYGPFGTIDTLIDTFEHK